MRWLQWIEKWHVLALKSCPKWTWLVQVPKYNRVDVPGWIRVYAWHTRVIRVSLPVSSRIIAYHTYMIHTRIRPTQLMIYVHLRVNIFQKSVLLIVQYKYLKLCSEDLFSRIWSSAQEYAVLIFLLNPAGFFISARSIWSGRNVLYQWGTGSQRANQWGWPLHICTWFIGSGGIRV